MEHARSFRTEILDMVDRGRYEAATMALKPCVPRGLGDAQANNSARCQPGHRRDVYPPARSLAIHIYLPT